MFGGERVGRGEFLLNLKPVHPSHGDSAACSGVRGAPRRRPARLVVKPLRRGVQRAEKRLDIHVEFGGF